MRVAEKNKEMTLRGKSPGTSAGELCDLKPLPLLLLAALLPVDQRKGASFHPFTLTPISPMATQPQQVVRGFLAAVQQGQFDLVAAALHPRVQWSQPGHHRLAGLKGSREEVFAMVGAMQEVAAGSLTLTAVDLLSTNGNRVACRVHWRAAQPPGAVLAVDNVDVYTIEGGLITQVLVFTADAAQEDAFWGQ
jgi:ketosteroid isomerase-like protein